MGEATTKPRKKREIKLDFPLWENIPEGKRVDRDDMYPPPLNCKAAVKWGDKYARCSHTPLDGEDFCWQHGGRKLSEKDKERRKQMLANTREMRKIIKYGEYLKGYGFIISLPE